MSHSRAQPSELQGFELNTIAECYDYSGDTARIDPAALRDYNARIQSSTGERGQGYKTSLDDLPNELLISIIQKAADYKASSLRLSRLQALLLLSLVSRRWADLILQTPSFWTTIDLITRGMEDLEAMIALQLELSRDHSLTLLYCEASDVIKRFAHLLQPHLHRITCLVLWPSMRMHSAISTGIDPFFPHTTFASLRHIISMEATPSRMVNFLSRHESFAPYADLAGHVGVTSECLGTTQRFTVDGRNLVSITLHLQSITTLQRIQDITTLEQVHISISPANNSSEDWSNNFKKRRDLLSWVDLQLRGSPWPVTHELLSRCPSLVILTLSIRWSDLGALYRVIPRLVSLGSLSINVSPENPQEITMTTTTAEIRVETKIRSITVWLSSYDTSDGVTIDVLYLLLRMSPCLESFNLSGYRGKALDYTEFDKLKYLQTLVLDKCDFTFDPDSNRHILASPSLAEIQISANVLNSLGSLTASRLIYAQPDHMVQPDQVTIQVCGKDWPALRALSLQMGRGEFPLGAGIVDFSLGTHIMIKRADLSISAMSLQRLTLSNRPLVTTMIHHLATNPTQLPILETLAIESCPEWDILFIMLEKRLLMQTSGIHPIQTILFSRVIPGKLKQMLSLLLAGYIVSRSSNYELSMQGNLDIFLDVDIPGCVECHLYLYPCDLPAREAALDQSELVMAYPKTADKIIRTQPMRFSRMESLYRRSNSHRELQCWRLRDMVEVSRHSIDLSQL